MIHFLLHPPLWFIIVAAIAIGFIVEGIRVKARGE